MRQMVSARRPLWTVLQIPFCKYIRNKHAVPSRDGVFRLTPGGMAPLREQQSTWELHCGMSRFESRNVTMEKGRRNKLGKVPKNF